MDFYHIKFDDFEKYTDIPFTLVEDVGELNKRIAREIADLIKKNNGINNYA